MYNTYAQVKVDAKVPVPEHLDLTMYRGKGIQPGEVLIPEGKGEQKSENKSEDKSEGKGQGGGERVTEETKERKQEKVEE